MYEDVEVYRVICNCRSIIIWTSLFFVYLFILFVHLYDVRMITSHADVGACFPIKALKKHSCPNISLFLLKHSCPSLINFTDMYLTNLYHVDDKLCGWHVLHRIISDFLLHNGVLLYFILGFYFLMISVLIILRN